MTARFDTGAMTTRVDEGCRGSMKGAESGYWLNVHNSVEVLTRPCLEGHTNNGLDYLFI